jgi:hypothetical protein
MIKTMIDLGLTEDDMIVNVMMEMTTIGNDDIDDIEMETERGGKRLMKSERKGGGREGKGTIDIAIGLGILIGLILERGVRGLEVGFEI